MMHAGKMATLGVALALAYPSPDTLAAVTLPVLAGSGRNLLDLSLEELSDVVVTSVSRRDQSLLKAAASVFIISGEEIRRVGASTLPEALRLAPNLQVAAIDARQYAISARGFNGNVANKLLVLVDGRTIYSPLFSGVFWDAQDFVPSNIDRIEVISGAAGATWGTNAVNGVINIVTKAAAETPGAAASLTVGSLERTATASYGLELPNGLALRTHVRAFKREASQLANRVLLGGGRQLPSGTKLNDANSGTSAGIRADWSSGPDKLMMTGGLYEGGSDSHTVYGPVDMRGSNLTVRWTRRLSDESDFDVQTYFDSTTRADNYLLQDAADIVDLEAKYRRTIGSHRWLTGLGMRRAKDHAAPGLIFAFIPATRQQHWSSVFAQDEIDLNDKLALTLGLRMERNPYSGWEALPNARLGYSPDADTLIWGALSRAVRSPARFDRDLVAPSQPPFVFAGGPDFISEIARVAEAGYRLQINPRASLSMTAFLHDYDQLRSGEVIAGQVITRNQIKGQIRGLEAWGNWQPRPDWRLDAGLLCLDKDLRLKAGSTDPTGPSNLGNDPNSQWSLRSSHSVGTGLDLAVAIRRVGRLPKPEIKSYTATDLTLNWSIQKDLRLTAGLRDVFDQGHMEYQGFSTRSEIPRSAFVTLSYGLP
jgi:iron complex outermembrane receptor protein